MFIEQHVDKERLLVLRLWLPIWSQWNVANQLQSKSLTGIAQMRSICLHTHTPKTSLAYLSHLKVQFSLHIIVRRDLLF